MALADGAQRTAVVVNPAKVEDLAELRRVVDGELAAAGWPAPRWYETTPEDPGSGQTAQALADGAEVVFAAGGDGTVRTCLTALAGSGAALAVLPAGTGNLLATNLGLPDDPRAGVKVVVERGRRDLDIGVVEGQGFAVMAGMGLDARMLDDASEQLKARVGPLAYVWSAMSNLLGRVMDVRLRLDGGTPLRRRARSVVVGNVGRLQGGIRLLPDAVPDDGMFDVAVIAPRTLGHWVALAWGVVRRHQRVPSMEVLRARHVVLEARRPEPRELDGDVIAPGRSMEITIRPGALTLCVPQPEESSDLAEGHP
jgi:diacylglycerol kinase family enzyme